MRAIPVVVAMLLAAAVFCLGLELDLANHRTEQARRDAITNLERAKFWERKSRDWEAHSAKATALATDIYRELTERGGK